MGSFSYLTISEYPTFTTKNYYIQEILDLIFQPDDYIVEERLFSKKNKLYWGDAFVNNKGSFVFRGFRQSVKVCKKRLEIFGASIKQAQVNWPEVRKRASKQLYFHPEYDFNVKRTSFKEYFSTLSYIIRNKIMSYEDNRESLYNTLLTDELLIAGQSLIDSLYLMLSAVDEKEIVEYDFTDIIDSGWVTDMPIDKIINEKIIILTEGKTDAEFLRKSVKLLYPYLSPYFHFMDFDGFKVEGGASILIKTINSFAAANVKHPIIALFDNDTAGINELNRLSKNLPENIKALRLPDIKLARKYPTVGPGGLILMNINGLACGIELYLGKSVLTTNNVLSKIRWTNYDLKLQKYHGSIENKEEIHSKFRQKMKENNSEEMEEMLELLECIFSAFKVS